MNLKVLHVVASVNPQTGGPARTVPELAHALGKAGVESVLATLDYEALGPQPAPDAYSLVSLPAGVLTRALRGWSPAFQRTLARLACEGVALVHNHGLWMFPNLYARQAAVRAKVPLIISPRGMLEGWALSRSAGRKALARRLFEGGNLEHAAMFHATSTQEAESIRTAGFRQPIACIPNGVDLCAAVGAAGRSILEDRHPELRGKRWILFMSRLHPVKGLPQLLRAWAAIERTHPDWHLLIAGESLDDYATQMRRLASELCLKGRTTFAGMLSGETKACALGHAEFFVLPTQSESFGVAIAEALACGLPVITTKAAPWAEIDSHRCGWWIERGEAPLRTALGAALRISVVERQAMGARSRNLAISRYARQNIGEEMKAAYHWLLGGGEPPACIRSGV